MSRPLDAGLLTLLGIKASKIFSDLGTVKQWASPMMDSWRPLVRQSTNSIRKVESVQRTTTAQASAQLQRESAGLDLLSRRQVRGWKYRDSVPGGRACRKTSEFHSRCIVRGEPPQTVGRGPDDHRLWQWPDCFMGHRWTKSAQHDAASWLHRPHLYGGQQGVCGDRPRAVFCMGSERVQLRSV